MCHYSKMFLFAHLGIGFEVAKIGWAKRRPDLSVPYVLLGTVLPDMIDKPIYYVSHDLLRAEGAFADFYAGTRGIAHTFLFAVLLIASVAMTKNKKILALTIGIATHLILDIANDLVYGRATDLRIFLWPFFGWNFPPAKFATLGAHIHFWFEPISLITEVVGLFLLWRRFKRREPRSLV